jgi:GAF domain-containing protein
MPRFLIHHASEGSRVFELLGERPIVVGRAKSNNLVLDNPSISRQHAVVRATEDGRWQIIDRGAANGVKVNGEPVKEAYLQANDEIILGEYRIRYFEDSLTRNMIAYGTPQLPSKVEKVIRESAYSGSFLPTQPLSLADSLQVEKKASARDRAGSLDQENRLLTLLYRANRVLSDVTTVEDATKRVLDLVLEMDGTERGFTMLLDKDSIGGGDFSRGGYGFEPALIRYKPGSNAWPGKGAPELTISQSIIRQVMHGGLPLLVSDPQADPRLSASASIANSGMQSAMCAPLGTRERRLGLLYVDNLSKRGMFTVDDLNIFTVIATQAGLAVDRTRPKEEPAESSQPAPAVK